MKLFRNISENFCKKGRWRKVGGILQGSCNILDIYRKTFPGVLKYFRHMSEGFCRSHQIFYTYIRSLLQGGKQEGLDSFCMGPELF